MRDALRDSLEKQWKTEQETTQQMSALAPDIKTPLTIVRGNAELLSETEPVSYTHLAVSFISVRSESTVVEALLSWFTACLIISVVMSSLGSTGTSSFAFP